MKETHYNFKDTHRFKVKRWKNIFHANGNKKKEGIAVFIPHKIHFKPKAVTEDKEGHYMMMKR